MLLPFLVSMCLIMTIMAYFSAKDRSFFQVYMLELNTFRRFHFTLGISCELREVNGWPVDTIEIGFVLFKFSFLAYKPISSIDGMELVDQNQGKE